MIPPPSHASALQLDLSGSSVVWSSRDARAKTRLRELVDDAAKIAESRAEGRWLVPPRRGDEIRQCFDTPETAAECALALLAHFSVESFAALGLPPMPPRIALHSGDVTPPGQYADGHAFLTLTVLEKIVEPGQAWGTSQFVSELQLAPTADIAFAYAGHYSFTKLNEPVAVFRLMPSNPLSAGRWEYDLDDPIALASSLLNSPREHEQEDALVALGQLADSRGTRLLFQVAQDPSRTFKHREAALVSLANVVDAGATDDLIALLNAEHVGPLRLRVIRALAATRNSEAVESLLSVAEDSRQPVEVREAALLGLHGMRAGRFQGRLSDVLSTLLRSPNIEIVRAASVACVAAGTPTGSLREALVECAARISHPTEVRLAAFESLLVAEPMDSEIIAMASDLSEAAEIRRCVLEYLASVENDVSSRILKLVASNIRDPLRSFSILLISQLQSRARKPGQIPRTTGSTHAKILALRTG